MKYPWDWRPDRCPNLAVGVGVGASFCALDLWVQPGDRSCPPCDDLTRTVSTPPCSCLN